MTRRLAHRPALLCAVALMVSFCAREASAEPGRQTPDNFRRSGLRWDRAYISHHIVIGAGFDIGEHDAVNMVVAAAVGPSLNWEARNRNHRVGFVPEAGFHSVFFDVEDGYYFQIGFRLEYERYEAIGAALHSYFIIGSAGDERSIGTRNGLGVNFFMGVVGIEVSHQLRTLSTGEPQHAIHLVAYFDWALLLHRAFRM